VQVGPAQEGRGPYDPRGACSPKGREGLFPARAKEERYAKVRIYDTGAMNHMSGSRVTFVDLDLMVCSMVRFSDDSVVEIEGCG
jgi:hypothetical protein